MSDTETEEAIEPAAVLPIDQVPTLEPPPDVPQPEVLDEIEAMLAEPLINPQDDDVHIIEEVRNVVEIEDTQPSPQPRPGRSRRMNTPKAPKKRRM
jgi:hypothetical protein